MNTSSILFSIGHHNRGEKKKTKDLNASLAESRGDGVGNLSEVAYHQNVCSCFGYTIDHNGCC